MTAQTPARTIAITSGKGGVGKSCVTANLGCALARRGSRVLVLDADLGLANMDILLNLQPVGTLQDVLDGARTLSEVLLKGPSGMAVLPSGSGLAEYARLTGEARARLPQVLSELVHDYDYILIDTGAGISEVVMYTASLAQEVLVVATPEPTSFADAYATIKVMASQQERSGFGIVVNQVRKNQSGQVIAAKLQQTADRFLKEQFGHRILLEFAGEIPADSAVEASVRARTPVLMHDAQSPAAREFEKLARFVAKQTPQVLGLRVAAPLAAAAGRRGNVLSMTQAVVGA
jgi:flagellar biosynthesis protein FlhG